MSGPMYRQIAEDLREQIESGRLEPGQQLLTELELREHYGASRNTVRDAIKWLTSLGLVETRPGQGTFVVRKIHPYATTLTTDLKKEPSGSEIVTSPEEGERYGAEVQAQLRTPSKSQPQVEIQKASGEVARELGLSEGSPVISRHQKRFIDGTPWSMQTSFYPWGFVSQGAEALVAADNIEIGAVNYLAKTLGLRQSRLSRLDHHATPNVIEAAFSSVPQDGRVRVFEITRTAYDGPSSPFGSPSPSSRPTGTSSS